MDPTLLTVLLAGGLLLVLATFMGLVLGWANKAFHVPVDMRVERINAVLPGANCGGCGCVGCNDFAEAVVAGTAKADGCPVGGASCAASVADIMGLSLEQNWPVRPIIHCAAKGHQRLQRMPYMGEQTCAAANLISGVQGCTYGCLGLGDCVRVCIYDAIHIVDELAVIDYDKCTGCGACVAACPRSIISQVPFKSEQILAVTCANKDFGKDVSSICTVGCIGCSACTKQAPVIRMDGKLPVVDYDSYDPAEGDRLERAIDKCPREALVWIGTPRPADLVVAAGQELPERVEAEFNTTVDQTEWRG